MSAWTLSSGCSICVRRCTTSLLAMLTTARCTSFRRSSTSPSLSSAVQSTLTVLPPGDSSCAPADTRLPACSSSAPTPLALPGAAASCAVARSSDAVPAS